MQCEPFEIARVVKNARTPAVLLRRRFDRTQNGVDINGFTVVAVMVFAESLHDGSFRQSDTAAKYFAGPVGKKFLTWFAAYINLSASVDTNGLMQSG